MGRTNGQRRAARQRRRRAERARRTDGFRGRERTAPEAEIGRLLSDAIHAWETEPDVHLALVDLLVALVDDGAPVDAAVARQLEAALDSLWQRGWTPADLVHVTARRATAAHAGVVRRAVVADGQRRAQAGAPPHARWQADLDDVWSDVPTASRSAEPTVDLHVVVAVLAVLSRLPQIPAVMPGPGGSTLADAAATARLDHRLLARVRALLAKAESTEFDEEAEALTAKAQELITRHAIADALAHMPDDAGDPSIRRMRIDGTYQDAKASLLSVVADANRCRAVHDPELGWVTLFGYDADLDAVQLLGTSLLAQATSALVRQGPRRGRDGRSTTRSFRRAFLFGFGARIGERLRDAADAEIIATRAHRTRLLPVLAARDDRVDDAVTAAFPQAQRRTTRIGNPLGWSAGRSAADLADLGGTLRLDDAP